MTQRRSVFRLVEFTLACVVATGALGAIAPTLAFLPAVVYDAGGNGPNALAVADLNQDGNQDVVVSHYTSIAGYPRGALGVLLGNPDATFQSPVLYDSGGVYAASVAAADVNGDGRPDLIVGNNFDGPAFGEGSGTVGVLLGNGDGTFQRAVTYSSGGILPTIAVADMNGDAAPDLLAANFPESTVGILLGNGDGTFRQVVTYESGGRAAAWVTPTDVNGDGRIDVLVANWIGFESPAHGEVAVLLGNGDGTLRPPLLYNSGGYGASSVAGTDLNGDGHQDIAVANCESLDNSCSSRGFGHGVVGVLLGNGDGTFREAVGYGLDGAGAGTIEVADLDDDGTRDLLVASCGSSACSSAVSVLRSNGDGTFKPVVAFPTGGFGAAAPGFADVNNDSRTDLLAATCTISSCSNGAVGVLINDTSEADTTPPALKIAATPTILWPPNGKLVAVEISGTLTDVGSGLNADSVTYAVRDEYGRVQPAGPVSVTAGGDYSFVVMLEASRRGGDKDGRVYRVTVQASDTAGNTTSKSATVIVPRHPRG